MYDGKTLKTIMNNMKCIEYNNTILININRKNDQKKDNKIKPKRMFEINKSC